MQTLTRFHQLSKGFASNFLRPSIRTQDRMRGDLYYADPTYLFDRQAALLAQRGAVHDYDIYDFSRLVVRKVEVRPVLPSESENLLDDPGLILRPRLKRRAAT